MKKFLSFLLVAIFITVPMTTSISMENKIDSYNNITEEIITINEKDSIKNLLVTEVNSYIKYIAPSSKLEGEVLVDMCYVYNVDIVFVLAQGQIESHYGTRGTAYKTNSVFNVGAYDGYSASRQCSNGFGFSHPNESVEPFLILLTNDYLTNGKTIDDLMISYVNHLGMRYASNTRYEYMLKSVYNKINKNTNISVLYNDYISLI